MLDLTLNLSELVRICLLLRSAFFVQPEITLKPLLLSEIFCLAFLTYRCGLIVTLTCDFVTLGAF
jgi:hypothetical protein